MPPGAPWESDTGADTSGEAPPNAVPELFGMAGGAGTTASTTIPNAGTPSGTTQPTVMPGILSPGITSPVERISEGITTPEIAPAITTTDVGGEPPLPNVPLLPRIPSTGAVGLPLIAPPGGLPATISAPPDNATLGRVAPAPGGGVGGAATSGVPALVNVANQYGSGPTTTTNNGSGSYATGSFGSGDAADRYNGVQSFQQAELAGMINLDNQLKALIDKLAANITSDRAQINRIINTVNRELNTLGRSADTPTGQLAVTRIVVNALNQALKIFGNGIANVEQTGNEVQQLTQQYIDDLNDLTPPSTGYGLGYGQPGTVQQWIQQAIQILEHMGYSPDEIDPGAIAIIIQHESSGNPDITNNWDSNAAAGTPSIGLMQTIGPTFDEYAAPGHNNIYNPVDNIIAGTRYAIARYGSTDNVPGVVAVRNGGSYVGY